MISNSSLRALIACLAVLSGHAHAQPAFEPVAGNEHQQRILEQIDALQTRDGTYSVALITPFTELASLYEESGDHGLAIAAIDRALHVVRINHGINSLEQAPLLRQAIRNEEARGNVTAAWDRERSLLSLARKHPSDLRTVPILREIADRRMVLLDRWVANEHPIEMVLGGYCGSSLDRLVCQRDTAAQQVLADAQILYAEAIEVILRNRLYSSEELRTLEMQLLRTSERIAPRPQIVDTGVVILDVTNKRDVIPARLALLGPRNASASVKPAELPQLTVRLPTEYQFGRKTLERLYDYEVASGASELDQLRAAIEIADWDLLYSRNSLALQRYQHILAALERLPSAQAAVDELFSPPVPVVLPSFVPNPLLTAETAATKGYVDVAFEITRFGEPRRIEIVGTSNATGGEAARLVKLIKGSRFRTRIVDGGFNQSSRVALRYYLDDPVTRAAE